MDAATKTSVVPAVAPTGDGGSVVPVAQQKPLSERKPVRARQDDKWKVFSGTANDVLAKDICEFLGLPLGQACIDKFSDGETYVQIEENVRGADVFMVQPTCDPVNEHLMQLLLLIDALKRASARRITVVIPYSAMPGRIARTSRACRFRRSWWRTC